MGTKLDDSPFKGALVNSASARNTTAAGRLIGSAFARKLALLREAGPVAKERNFLKKQERKGCGLLRDLAVLRVGSARQQRLGVSKARP